MKQELLSSMDEDLVSQYSSDFVRNNGVIKLFEDSLLVRIAAVESCSSSVRTYLEEFHLPKKTVFVEVGKSEFASYVGKIAASEMVFDKPQSRNDGLLIDEITRDAPVVNIINAICIDAINRFASDIHIESMKECVRIRYRIDGFLQTVKTVDNELFAQISSRLKIMANLNIMERRLPQDGRMTVTIGGDNIDLRVSTIPVTWGESIVLRIFNTGQSVLKIEELGFYDRELDVIKKSILSPHGLILATGPTGCGKTTTLHSMLNLLNDESLNIIALEDPVEQIIHSVNQVQINADIDLTFDKILKRVLRQDPNIIMVGEIRDSDTADIALRSSLTGHLILSTLHTNTSVAVISRLKNMGVDPYLIAAVLKCSISQRLVRKVCPCCAVDQESPDSLKRLCGKYEIEVTKIKRSVGCPVCGHTGYSGRTVIAEVFMVTEDIETMIVEEALERDIYSCLTEKGMSTLEVNALRKVAEGITTIQEADREVVFPW